MFNFTDMLRRTEDLILPVVILGVELICPEAVLTGSGADHLLVIDMEGNPVTVRQLLRQNRMIVPLDFFHVALPVDDAVETDAIAAEQPSNIPGGAEGGF